MSKIFRIFKVVGVNRIVPYLLFRLNEYFQKKHDLKGFFRVVPFFYDRDKRFLYARILLNSRSFILKSRRKGSDCTVFEQVILNKEYYRLTRLLPLLPNKDQYVVIDAGANIGLFTLYASAHLNNSSFICIEPNSANYQILVENIRLNEIPIIGCYEKALWHVNEAISLGFDFRDQKPWSYSLISNSERLAVADEVKTVTLSDILNEHDISEIDILKMDIEGAEKYLLEDDRTQKLIFGRVLIFIIELHEEVYTENEFVKLLDKYDYTFLHEGETFFAVKKALLK